MSFLLCFDVQPICKMSGRISYCPNWQLVLRTGSHPVTVTVKTLLEHLWERLILLYCPKMPGYILSLSLTHVHCFTAFFLRHFPCSPCICLLVFVWKTGKHGLKIIVTTIPFRLIIWLPFQIYRTSLWWNDCSERQGQFPFLSLLQINKISQ